MPYREPVNKGEVYHVFNRGVDKREIFLKNQDYLRFILALYILNDAENRYDIWTSLNFKKEATLSLLKSTIGTPGVPIVDTRLRFVELLEQGKKTTGVQNEARALKQQNMYPWTSYHDYIGNLKFPIVTDRDFYLELLNNSEGCRSSVEDWIKFKAETADIPEYLKKVL